MGVSENSVVSHLWLDGHDSELFSFLEAAYIGQLKNHPSAQVPLYSFGDVREGKVRSIPVWNSSPSCFAWTYQPSVTKFSDSDEFWNYRGFVTDDRLIRIEALTLVRWLFDQSNTCALNDNRWIDHRADPTLQRLRYIRGWGGQSAESPEWIELQASYFDWCLKALEQVPCDAFISKGL